MWCVPKLTEEFKERMEDVLALYAEPYDPKKPVVCLDEKSKQLLEDSRAPLPAVPGKTACQDYEYVRKGTCNIFVAVEPKGGRRCTKVTERRTKLDYAHFVEHLLAEEYPDAECLRIVQDNLNIHNEQSLVAAFGKRTTRKLMKRIEFHPTPKHASWLNMAEIEIGVLSRQCLQRRIASMEDMRRAVRAWERRRNRQHKGITWKFTQEKAQETFPSLYE